MLVRLGVQAGRRVAAPERAVADTDAADLFSLDADAGVRRFLDQPVPPTLDEIRRDMIPRWQTFDVRTPEVGYWVAEATDGAGFLGWFHLRPPKPDGPLQPDDMDLGYRLRRGCWGTGLATEGGTLLLQYAFDRLKAPRVTAMALKENTASIRVMEKLGMRYSEDFEHPRIEPGHPLRRHVLYRLTRAEWISSQRP